MGKEVVGSMSEWSGVLKDIFRQVDDGSLILEHFKALAEHQNPFEVDFSALIRYWQKFYEEIFNLRVDFSGVPVPEAPDEFSWFVCVPESMTTEQTFSGMKKQFPIWKYTNKPLDDVLDLSFGRDARQHPYIIRLRANIEADKDLKNLSANDIAAQKINTTTLKERLLLSRFLYWKEKSILDREVITLCSGSRCSDGHVPSVHWHDDRLKVYWYRPDLRYDCLRSRRVVS